MNDHHFIGTCESILLAKVQNSANWKLTEKFHYVSKPIFSRRSFFTKSFQLKIHMSHIGTSGLSLFLGPSVDKGAKSNLVREFQMN